MTEPWIPRPGDRVRYVEDDPFLHGATGVVVKLCDDYGRLLSIVWRADDPSKRPEAQNKDWDSMPDELTFIGFSTRHYEVAWHG